tara:strand:- start:4669 stop:4920 length:252 start_codon:yes stop_codon:yes gene_type:complete
MLNPAQIYDPRFHTFDSWAALMCELYAPQQLEIPSATMDWRIWGNGIRAIDVFANEAIPMTENFDNWFDWAEALVNAVNPAVA